MSSWFEVREEFLEPGTKNNNYKRKILLNSTASNLRPYPHYEKEKELLELKRQTKDYRKIKDWYLK